MEIVKKRRLNEIILGFFLLSHPVPVMFHVIAVTLFTLLAAWQRPVWSVIVLVIAAHTAMQVSIAMINDYCDRQLDAEGKKNKPIPRGLVTPREALITGLVMIAVMLALLLLPALWYIVRIPGSRSNAWVHAIEPSKISRYRG